MNKHLNSTNMTKTHVASPWKISFPINDSIPDINAAINSSTGAAEPDGLFFNERYRG